MRHNEWDGYNIAFKIVGAKTVEGTTKAIWRKIRVSEESIEVFCEFQHPFTKNRHIYVSADHTTLLEFWADRQACY